MLGNIIGLFNINTIQTVLVFTDMGNYLFLPVYEIPEVKWKDMGKHVSNIISMDAEEKIIGAMPVYDFDRAVKDGATVPLYYQSRGEKNLPYLIFLT